MIVNRAIFVLNIIDSSKNIIDIDVPIIIPFSNPFSFFIIPVIIPVMNDINIIDIKYIIGWIDIFIKLNIVNINGIVNKDIIGILISFILFFILIT